MSVVGDLAACAHAVYLLVVVKMPRLIKGRCYDHALLRFVEKLDLCVKRAGRAEALHLRYQRAHARAVVFKINAVIFADGGRVAGLARFGQLALSERHEAHGACGDLPALLEVEKAYRVQTHVAVIVDGEGKGKAAVVYEVIVPFLDAHGACLDVRAPVNRQELLGVARLRQLTVGV